MGTLNYLKNLFTDKNVASVTPSSEFTVKRVCSKIDFSKDIVIVEYGPGDGVFTKFLLENMNPASRLFAIETNEGFVKLLSEIDDPRFTIVHDSAENVEKILFKNKIQHADYVISGIPFSFLPKSAKTAIISSTAHVLKNDGAFLVYQTSKHIFPNLKQHFSSVDDELEIKNIPPMVVMTASKPIRG